MNIKPRRYDANMTPKLFTELDPADLQVKYDQDGLRISQSEADLIEMHAQLAKSDRYRVTTRVQDREKEAFNLMIKRQPKGEFKLDRKIYFYLLEQCKDGDVTYVRMR